MAHSAPTTRLSGQPVGPEEPSVGSLVQSAMSDVSTLIRNEVELAKAEIGGSVKKVGLGGGLVAVGGVMALYCSIFLFIGIAELLTWLGLPRFVSYFIVFGVLLLLAGLLVLVGIRTTKKFRKPERTIETLKDLPDVMRREAPGQRQHDLPVVRDGHIERAAPHARLG
ncbi:phage holin family protein [Klenkia brasiliensis]|uniref:Putative Holin-X, holin superfamily III n=1 Tax=Klenkia brasiliensis TaxID=333142 RepID=A0A1G7MIA7_9ACTN|nr:phage holin family protein [Klenkia brasiliensis]SDF60879.1 Putative Holin-X, holin superfamily III [Klenkia brasiliensis]